MRWRDWCRPRGLSLHITISLFASRPSTLPVLRHSVHSPYVSLTSCLRPCKEGRVTKNEERGPDDKGERHEGGAASCLTATRLKGNHHRTRRVSSPTSLLSPYAPQEGGLRPLRDGVTDRRDVGRTERRVKPSPIPRSIPLSAPPFGLPSGAVGNGGEWAGLTLVRYTHLRLARHVVRRAVGGEERPHHLRNDPHSLLSFVSYPYGLWVVPPSLRRVSTIHFRREWNERRKWGPI